MGVVGIARGVLKISYFGLSSSTPCCQVWMPSIDTFADCNRRRMKTEFIEKSHSSPIIFISIQRALWICFLFVLPGVVQAVIPSEACDAVFHLVCDDNRGGYWGIAGADSSVLLHVSPDGEVDDWSHRLPAQVRPVRLTALQAVEPHHLFVGTNSDHLFWLRGSQVSVVDARSGLADSCVVDITYHKQRNQLWVYSPGRVYRARMGTLTRALRFESFQSARERQRASEFRKWVRDFFQKPVQKAICLTLGNVDYSFHPQKVIDMPHIRRIHKRLKPGDILIKRNDFQMSNWGIPGFWTHAAIYIGNLDELDDYFGVHPQLGDRLFSEWLSMYYPNLTEPLSHGHPMIIEAVAEGVRINPIEHIARVDYLAALRPALACDEMLQSLLNAFHYYGRPYDFLFDPESEQELVCSELVVKSFSITCGMTDEAADKAPHPLITPNDIARQICQSYLKQMPSLDLILFCGKQDGDSGVGDFDTDQFCKTVE